MCYRMLLLVFVHFIVNEIEGFVCVYTSGDYALVLSDSMYAHRTSTRNTQTVYCFAQFNSIVSALAIPSIHHDSRRVCARVP